MKKLLTVLVLALMLCGLAACTDKPAEKDTDATTEMTMPTMTWSASEVILPEDVFD